MALELRRIFVLLLAGLEVSLAVGRNWKKYPINKFSIELDILQCYLGRRSETKIKNFQGSLEETLNSGNPIELIGLNMRESYERQFYEGHASMGGRIINVEGILLLMAKIKES